MRMNFSIVVRTSFVSTEYRRIVFIFKQVQLVYLISDVLTFNILNRELLIQACACRWISTSDFQRLFLLAPLSSQLSIKQYEEFSRRASLSQVLHSFAVPINSFTSMRFSHTNLSFDEWNYIYSSFTDCNSYSITT